MKLSWTALFSYRFVTGKHINLGFSCLWIHAWFWELSRKDDQAHRKSAGIPPGRTQLMPRLDRELVCGATEASPLPAATLASTQARSELDLLREPVSAAAPSAAEQMVLSAIWNLDLPARERPSTSLREYFLDFKRDASTSCKCQKKLEGREILPIRHVGLTRRQSSLFRVGSMRLWSSPCHRARDIEKHTVAKRAFPLRGQDILVQYVMLTTATRYDMAVSEIVKYFRVWDIRGLEELVRYRLNELDRVCIRYLRTCFASGNLGPSQAGTLISGLRRHLILARACGAALENVFRTLWSVHQSWSLSRLSSGQKCLTKSC